MFNDYPRMLAATEEDYRAWIDRLSAAATANRFFKVIGPTGSFMDTFLMIGQRASIEREMVLAGLAVIQNGTEAIHSHPDPATGKPFVYTRTADGFDLTSGFRLGGEPVKLSFRQTAQP